MAISPERAQKIEYFFRKNASLLIIFGIDFAMLVYVLAFFLLRDTPLFFLVGSTDCSLWNAHLYCIGCGGTRAVDALSRFDIIESLCLNPYPAVWGFTIIYANLHTVILHVVRLKKKMLPPVCPYWGPVLWWATIFSILYVPTLIILLLCGIDLVGDHGTFWPEFFATLS